MPFVNVALMNGGWRAGWSGNDGQSFDISWSPTDPTAITLEVIATDGDTVTVNFPAVAFATAALAVNHARESRVFTDAVWRAQKVQRDAQEPGGAT